MKVSIITRHAIANYGSLLQSVAIEKIFQKLGFETEIINYIPESEKIENLVDSYIKNSNLWNKNFLTRIIYKVLQNKNVETMNKKFNTYQHNYLHLTKIEYNSTNDLRNEKPKADVYCTGSDQVWGAIGSEKYDKNYFLDFLDENDKAITYAASFGKEKISKELKSELEELTKKYKKILVREDSAKDILKEENIENVEQVIDPTLFLNEIDWNDICINKRLVEDNYILIYQLHHNKELDKYAKKIAKATGKKLIRINTSKYFKYKNGEFIYLPTPGEWLSYIKNADLVITDSFHGTCFSIIYNKEFIDILPKVTGTRIISILRLFNIEDRLIKDYNDISIINSKIDYNNVNKVLINEQKESTKKIKKALKMCGVLNEK